MDSPPVSIEETRIRDIPIREAIIVSPNSTVINAAKKMRSFRVGSLIVVSGRKVQGIITKGDLVFRVLAEGLDHTKVRVAQVASREVISVQRETTVQDALQRALDCRIRQLVVTENGTAVGIISAKDLIQSMPGVF